MAEMIRRLALALALLLSTIAGAGCVQVAVSGNVGYLLLIPVLMDDGGGINRTATSYTDTRWFADPDSHPAVRPAPKKPSAQPAAPTGQ